MEELFLLVEPQMVVGRRRLSGAVADGLVTRSGKKAPGLIMIQVEFLHGRHPPPETATRDHQIPLPLTPSALVADAISLQLTGATYLLRPS